MVTTDHPSHAQEVLVPGAYPMLCMGLVLFILVRLGVQPSLGEKKILYEIQCHVAPKKKFACGAERARPSASRGARAAFGRARQGPPAPRKRCTCSYPCVRFSSARNSYCNCFLLYLLLLLYILFARTLHMDLGPPRGWTFDLPE
jgi:hypothetical protein